MELCVPIHVTPFSPSANQIWPIFVSLMAHLSHTCGPSLALLSPFCLPSVLFHWQRATAFHVTQHPAFLVALLCPCHLSCLRASMSWLACAPISCHKTPLPCFSCRFSCNVQPTNPPSFQAPRSKENAEAQLRHRQP